MEPRQSRCVGSVNRESAVSYVAASRCYSFSSKVKRQKERAGERLCLAHSLIRRSRCTIFAERLVAALLFFPANSADRIRSASCVESVSAAFITSPGTHLGKGIRRDTCAPKDLAAFSVSPPAASNWFACNGLRQARHWTARGLEHHSMTLDESDSISWTHFFLHFAQSPCWDQT